MEIDAATFTALARRLVHPAGVPAEARTHLFHGCLAESIAGISSEGLRVRRGEPSLTPNPASALWKYANPARSSRHRYGGAARASVERLIAEGALARGDDPVDQLSRAATIWQTRRGVGAAFVLALAPSAVVAPAEAQIHMTRDGVIRGGISKWVYAHLALSDVSGQATAVVPPSAVLGYLETVAAWTGLFEQFHPMRRNAVPASDVGERLAGRILASDASFTWTSKPADAAALARAIVHGLTWGFLLQEVRKLLLAFAAAAGATFVKDDVEPPDTWTTDTIQPATATFEQLRRVRYHEADADDARAQWIDRLHAFGHECQVWGRPASRQQEP